MASKPFPLLASATLGLILCFTLSSTGCGQKGPLYLPTETQKPAQRCPDQRCEPAPTAAQTNEQPTQK